MEDHISFFIPAYQCEPTLKEAVDSIMQGNFHDGDELIIVNDGSTDRTENVIQELKHQYPGCIRSLQHVRNKGGAAARNTAVEHAKHDLLFCLDADNVLVPGSVRRLQQALRQWGADAAAFREIYFFVGSPDYVVNRWSLKSGWVTLADVFSSHQHPGSSGNYLFTKESWLRAGGYPEESSCLDTWGFALRQLASGSRIVVVPDGYYYHRHGIESYYIRESRKGKINLTALQLLVPYLDLISPSDVEYIFSREGRHAWFQQIEIRPLRLKGMDPESSPDINAPSNAATGQQKIPSFMSRQLHEVPQQLPGFGHVVWSQKLN